MQVPGMVKKRGAVQLPSQQPKWTQQHEQDENIHVPLLGDEESSSCDSISSQSILESDRFRNETQRLQSLSTFSEIRQADQNDTSNNETSQLLLSPHNRNSPIFRNISFPSLTDKFSISTLHESTNYGDTTGDQSRGINGSRSNSSSSSSIKNSSPPSSENGNSLLPLYHHHASPDGTDIDDIQQQGSTKAKKVTTTTTIATTVTVAQTKAIQLLIGASGIYAAYLYYGVVQEDLFRYRSANGIGFSFVWALQVLESAVTMAIGYVGRKLCGGRKNLPLTPFFHSGVSQLAAKAFMSLSLAAGLSFPVVVLAKSAKIVPVMIGQLVLGGSKYSSHDYLFAVLIVVGTSLLSAGNSSEHVATGSDTLTGLALITLSLMADGFTGGLQKKLKRVTASMAPTTYDFLFYSHVAQFCAAVVICFATGEVYTAPVYLIENPTIWWWIGASCVCSAIGQCFIFYVISCFDPVVCTTITTTRKMLTVMFSIGFKGHHLSNWGYIGLGLAVSALLLEVEVKYAKYRLHQKGTIEEKKQGATTVMSNSLAPSHGPISTPDSLLS